MGLEKLTLESISRIDGGRIRAAVEQAIARCYNDVLDRPSLKTMRKVALTVKITPIPDDSSLGADSCNVEFDINESIPRRTSKKYNMQATNAGLLYQELSPEDVRQATLDHMDEPREVTRDGDAPESKERVGNAG